MSNNGMFEFSVKQLFFYNIVPRWAAERNNFSKKQFKVATVKRYLASVCNGQ